jgi:hypothetical protein
MCLAMARLWLAKVAKNLSFGTATNGMRSLEDVLTDDYDIDLSDFKITLSMLFQPMLELS